MIQAIPFHPVVTGFAQLSCAGTTDAEAVALFPLAVGPARMYASRTSIG